MTSKKTTLGNTTNNASEREKTNKRLKEDFRLLDTAQKIMQRDNHRVCICSKILQHDQTHAVVSKTTDGKVALSNTMKCDNVWACPLCSRKISEQRRIELQHGVNEAKRRGWQVLMMTNTISHTRGDLIQDLKIMFSMAWRKFTSGRKWQDLMTEYDIVGRVRAIEVTHSAKNGWHIHSHTLLFIDSKPDFRVTPLKIQSELALHWSKSAHKCQAFASIEHGTKVTESSDVIADYITKYGKQPADIDDKLAEVDTTWNESHELAKAVVKKSHTAGSRTPFAILSDAADGDEQSAVLYRDYVLSMKHVRQLVWSNGLKEELLVAEALKEAEAAADAEAEEVIIDATLSVSRHLWKEVSRSGKRGEVMVAMATDDHNRITRLLDYMIAVIRLKAPQYTHLVSYTLEIA